MSTKLELSDHLILEAASAGAKAARDAADQVEFWANLGKAMDSVLSSNQVEILSQPGQGKTTMNLLGQVKALESALNSVDLAALNQLGLAVPTIESLLDSTQAARTQLEQNPPERNQLEQSQLLEDLLDQVEEETGRERLAAHLAELPFPHYEPFPEDSALMVRIEADGARTVGRFVQRVFTPVGHG